VRLLSYLDAEGRPRCGALVATPATHAASDDPAARGQPGAGAGAAPGGDARILDLTETCAGLDVPAAVAAEFNRRGLAPASGGLLRLLQAGAEGLRIVREKVEAESAANAAGPTSNAARSAATGPRLADVTLLAPIPRPGKIVAIGRNYGDHAKETGTGPFEAPRLIAKLSSTVVGPNAQVRRPPSVRKMDFEVELAVVISAFAHQVPKASALDVVAGYTVLDDLSAREFQFDVEPAQTTFAKSMDGFCPMGPWLVTRDEVPDPQRLAIRCAVNGATMQEANTADMIFPVAELIEYITRFMTLEPGDVIATGTPAGVGAFRKPPVWLQPGDQLRLEVEGVGVLEHGIG